MNFVRTNILVCGGTGCTSSKSPEIIEEFNRQLKAFKLEDEAKVVQTGCFGLCAVGPIVVVYPEGTYYCHVKVGDVKDIVSEHILKGRILQRLLYTEETGGHVIHSLETRISIRSRSG
jgi:Ferredoxin